MQKVQTRYSKITHKFPREFVLLQGKGCFWKKCAFCDYYQDISSDPFSINKDVIKNITGEFKVLDVINSGSAMELDSKTLNFLKNKIYDCSINELWFEVHWAYRNVLEKFAKQFPECNVNFRTGVETFDPHLRTFWNKGIPENVTPEDIAKYFKSVCLLIGTENQNFDSVIRDIEIAEKYFDHYMINVFVPNSTSLKKNSNLINRFINEIYPNIKNNSKAEISLNITDLGVG